MTGADNIQPFHRQRLAIVYLRQSSPHQTIAHQESLRLQQNLSQRAAELGWPPRQVQVFDADLGLSGRSVQGRSGLHEVQRLVGLGQVGLILAYEVTRLTRNCSDWYPILDLCTFHHCLVGDQDGIYDPSLPNDRMLLGMKGLISEWELHSLHLRLTAGLRSKASRGELAQPLPTGLVRDTLGQVHKHPDQEVQSRLALIFTTFPRVRTVPALLRFFLRHDLTLPRRDRFGDIYWRRPTVSALSEVLTNPAYAGAFVRGRTRCERSPVAGRRPCQKRLPREKWPVVVRDKYPAYLDWETYAKIQDMLHDNHARALDQRARGAPRSGQALLHGLLCCGTCAHRLVVRYQHGIKYVCNYHRRQRQDPVCQYLPGAPLDAFVEQALLEALTPAAFDLDVQALAQWQQNHAQIQHAQEQQRERLRYQAQLVERQFRQVDPANRLVAAELENRWEQALEALRDAEAQSAAVPSAAPDASLTPELRAALIETGTSLPDWWRRGRIGRTHQKALLRCLVDKVVVRRSAPDRVTVRLVWKGGATTTAEVPVPVHAWSRLSSAEEINEKILRLVQAGLNDTVIAEHLTAAGHRSPRSTVFLASTVQTVRLRNRALRRPGGQGSRQTPGSLTVAQLARRLQVPPHWIYDRIHRGIIRVHYDADRRVYQFPDRSATLSRFRNLLTGKKKNLKF